MTDRGEAGSGGSWAEASMPVYDDMDAVTESLSGLPVAAPYRLWVERRTSTRALHLVAIDPTRALRHETPVCCDPFDTAAVRALAEQLLGELTAGLPPDPKRDAVAEIIVNRRVRHMLDGEESPVTVMRLGDVLRLDISPLRRVCPVTRGIRVGSAAVVFHGDPFSEQDVLQAIANLAARDAVHERLETLTCDDGALVWDPHALGVGILAPARPAFTAPSNLVRPPYRLVDFLSLCVAAWRAHRRHRRERRLNETFRERHRAWLGTRERLGFRWRRRTGDATRPKSDSDSPR